MTMRYQMMVPAAFGAEFKWIAQENYVTVCKWAGHTNPYPAVVCIDHQSLQSWHRERVDTLPSCPVA